MIKTTVAIMIFGGGLAQTSFAPELRAGGIAPDFPLIVVALLALRRGFPLSVKESAKLISNIVYSSMKSYNPFYVELVVAGVDREGAHVYTSDMSGAITSEDFMSSGSGSPIAYGVLEQGFRKEFNLDEAKKLAEAAVRAAMERDPGSGNGVDVLAIPNGHSLELN